MGRMYVVNAGENEILARAMAGQLEGVMYEHVPKEPDGMDSLWPHKLHDGKDSVIWTEGAGPRQTYLHAWGASNETAVLAALRKAGLKVRVVS